MTLAFSSNLTIAVLNCDIYTTYLVAQMVKNLPTMQETHLWFKVREDSLEKGVATHSSILAWRILWMEEPGRLQSIGSQRVRHDEQWTLSLSHYLHFLWWPIGWVYTHHLAICFLFVPSILCFLFVPSILCFMFPFFFFAFFWNIWVFFMILFNLLYWLTSYYILWLFSVVALRFTYF